MSHRSEGLLNELELNVGNAQNSVQISPFSALLSPQLSRRLFLLDKCYGAVPTGSKYAYSEYKLDPRCYLRLMMLAICILLITSVTNHWLLLTTSVGKEHISFFGTDIWYGIVFHGATGVLLTLYFIWQDLTLHKQCDISKRKRVIILQLIITGSRGIFNFAWIALIHIADFKHRLGLIYKGSYVNPVYISLLAEAAVWMLIFAITKKIYESSNQKFSINATTVASVL